MFPDPIVEEVRAIREQLAAQFDFDIRKIVEDAQRRQAMSQSRIISFQHPINAAQSDSEFPPVSDTISSQQASPVVEL